MKFFITGGAGFIGSNMTDILLRKNEVTVFDNLTSGNLDFLKQHKENKKFNFIKGDLTDMDKVRKTMKGHDFVFHFASNPDIARGAIDTSLDLKQGVLVTYNILESMRRNDIKKIVFPSGSGVYGDVGELYTKESYGPLLPVSMYGASKLGIEGLISAFSHMFGMRSWIYRFANVVGERQTHGVMLDFIKKLKDNPRELKILGDGRQSKSYIHVTDCIDAMLFTINNSNEVVNIFNVATNDFTDVNRIAQIVAETMKLKNVKFSYTGGRVGWKGDVPIVRLDTEKITKMGWKPKMNSEEAVKKATQEILRRLQ